MYRLLRFKNLMALVWVCFILAIVLHFISTGWVDIFTHLSQLLLIVVFGYFLTWNIRYRQEHDPVRRFCFKVWNVFWNRFA